MTQFLQVLPQRDEIGVTLTKGGFVEISQEENIQQTNHVVRIHADDIPTLIAALTGAMNASKADL